MSSERPILTNVPTAMLVLMCWLTGLGQPACAQEAAELAPSDTGVFVELRDMARFRTLWPDDPIVQFIEGRMPSQRRPEVWGAIARMLGISERQLFDRYFGQVFVVTSQKPGDNSPSVVFLEVSRADMALAQQRLGLVRVRRDVGGFTLYRTPDRETWIAMGRKWVAISGAKDGAYLRNVLEHRGRSLARDRDFRTWTGKLPEPRTALLYVQDRAQSVVHVLGGHRDHRQTTINYVGLPNDSPLLRKLGSVSGEFDISFLPRETAAAVAFNVLEPNAPKAPWLDALVAPRSFKNDVWPQIDAPIVLFLGRVRGQQLEPDPGITMPVLGAAIRLRDPRVSDDLDRLVDGLLTYANLAAAQNQLRPFLLDRDEHRGMRYRTAAVGQTLFDLLQARGVAVEEAKSIKLAYGRVGDWYVITTQDVYFRLCRDAESDPRQRYDPKLRPPDRLADAQSTPILAAVVRPDLLHQMAGSVVNRWRQLKQGPLAFPRLDGVKPDRSPQEHLVHALTDWAEGPQIYERIRLWAQRERDRSVSGEFTVTRKHAGHPR